jgi:hypothetical protein
MQALMIRACQAATQGPIWQMVYMCESLGKLESLLDRNLQKFTTVFIDESHRR